MRKRIISFLLAIGLLGTVVFYLSSYGIFSIDQKQVAVNQPKKSAINSPLMEGLGDFVHESAKVIKQQQKDLPTLEETRERMEREKQEAINRTAIALGITPKEAESMLYPTTEDYSKLMQSMQKESEKVMVEINKSIEKSKNQASSQGNTRQEYKSLSQTVKSQPLVQDLKEQSSSIVSKLQGPSKYVNVNGTFINENELSKTVNLDSFAECLSIKGIKMYGTSWSHLCNEQKELFGSSFDKVWFIDCDKERQHCLDVGVRGFPAWIDQNGNQYPGKQDLGKLSKISGCPINK